MSLMVSNSDGVYDEEKMGFSDGLLFVERNLSVFFDVPLGGDS